MEKGEFLSLCKRKGYSDKDIASFEKALNLVDLVFGDEQRESGGRVSYHNMMVGHILADIKSGPEVVLAGILHSLAHRKEVEEIFGPDVYGIVKGFAEIKAIKQNNQNLQAEAIKKILVTTLTDMRVMVVKLANEVEDFRNIEELPKDKQARIASEAMEIYAPLAYRLGNEKIRVALENLSFKILNPKQYAEIDEYLKGSSEEREKDIQEAIGLIGRELHGKVRALKIKGRPKHIYSIYRKMINKGYSLDDLLDLLGIRIIVAEDKDCYTAMATLHEKFEPIEGRLKDYVARPKENYYRSIHTGVRLPSGKIVEVQIRTKEMDEFAEEGLAAHWKYKGAGGDEAFEKRIGWLKGILEIKNLQGNKEFLEATKVDVFGDRMYCYTPKGDVKELPVGASVLDFAFLVHEQVGNKAVAGRVNGRFVPLRHELKKGDVVEIQTNKNQRPHRTWLKFVKTAGARQKIRKQLKEHEKLAPIHYKIPKVMAKEADQVYLVESREFANAVCVLAKCCRPLPGEEIIGIPTKRRVISVHRSDCKQALKEEDRWTKVYWKESFAQKIRFYVNAMERSGLLADLLHNIANVGFEVKEAKAKLTGPQDMECQFLVVPRSLKHLEELVKRVKKVKGVRRMYFEG